LTPPALDTAPRRAHPVAVRVGHRVDAQLEGPAASLDIGHIDVDDAVKLYQQYAGQAAFVDAAAPR